MIVLWKVLTLLGLAVLLPEFSVSPLVRARVTQPEDDAEYETSDDANQIADQAEDTADDGMNEGPVQPRAATQVQMVEIPTSIAPIVSVTKPPGAALSKPMSAAPVKAIAHPIPPETAEGVDAQNAHIAANSAMHAADVANKVAVHSVHIAKHARDALKDAHDAVHEARVTSEGLSGKQKADLKTAEAKLKEASKTAEFGTVKNAHYVKAEVENKKLQKLETKLETVKKVDVRSELEVMRKEIAELRQQLKGKAGDTSDEESCLQDLEAQIIEMEKAEAKQGQVRSHDEIKAELERLRILISQMDDKVDDRKNEAPRPNYQVKMEDMKDDDTKQEDAVEVTPISAKGIDIDTAMPYGDLEPFGREDTAQELTEDSIRESDQMVDQLERSEVAEEKRAVFRALTRLRGAALTSFDGIARAQTGQIDEYNKIHQWRRTHPLHHLADEESDVSKWAFPDNAD